jgi:hypothetical protein
MAKLKPWFHVVAPREDLREGKPLDASEFAVHLDHIRLNKQDVSRDYSLAIPVFPTMSLVETDIKG